MRINLAGVVVLYNPTNRVKNNIHSYLDSLDKLYIVDNSDKINTHLIHEIINDPKIKVIAQRGNIGIASALNLAANQAIKDGYNWLLTMDQDSRASADMMSKLIKFIEDYPREDLGLVSPYHANKFEKRVPIKRKYESMITVMTSGNIVNLKTYKKVGGFLEKLFIDHVDHEYCLRLNKNKYKVIRIPSAILHHNLGNIQYIRNRKVINHNYIRWYYKVRNQFYIINIYKDYFPQWVKDINQVFIKQLIDVIFFEKGKFPKLINMLRGYIDYKRNKFGKYRYSLFDSFLTHI